MLWLIARRLRGNDGETSRFYLQFDGQLARQLHQHGRYIGKMLHGATVLAEHSCAMHKLKHVKLLELQLGSNGGRISKILAPTYATLPSKLQNAWL